MHYYALFFQVINMSITGGVVILAVLVLRLFLRRAPRLISYCLWAVVLFRLLCPFSFSLPVSLLETVGSPAAEEWRSAAAIYRTEAEGLVFSGGILSDVLLMDNHCGLAVLEPVKDCEEQALLCGFECDLFTASEIGEAEEAFAAARSVRFTDTAW